MANATQMLAEMKTTEQASVLTRHGAASAVVQDFDAHQRLQNALLMLKLMVQGEAGVPAGRTAPQDRVFKNIKARLAAVMAVLDARRELSSLHLERLIR